ncbi:MAG TPA: YwiC-like family protein [Pyrinomonadaceae bacterium]
MTPSSFVNEFRETDSAHAVGRDARVRLRSVALPVEHGGWGLLLEPIALGLLVAPSLTGFCLSFAAAGAFLARHPFKIVIADLRRRRRFPRTAAAERFALLYGFISVAGMIGAAATAADFKFLLPLLAATPFAATQLFNDVKGRSRSLIAETTGAVALAALSASVALAGGWEIPAAVALWAVLAARAVPAILYVRARIAELHGETPSVAPSLFLHGLALVAVLLLTLLGVASGLALLAMCVLLLRAVHGFSAPQQAATARQIGVREIGFGALTVFAVAAGHLLRW